VCLCLCLCLAIERLIGQGILQRQEVLCLQPYFEQIDAAIWPRFQLVLDLNIERSALLL
jgi:hypothetical protein